VFILLEKIKIESADGSKFYLFTSGSLYIQITKKVMSCLLKVSISLFTLHVATSKLKSMEWTQIPINENNRATNTNI